MKKPIWAVESFCEIDDMLDSAYCKIANKVLQIKLPF